MNKKFSSAIFIASFVTIIIYGILFTVAVVATMLQPTFYPNVDVSGFERFPQTSSIILGFISAVLAVVSIYMAIKSNEEYAALRNVIGDLDKHVNAALKHKPYVDVYADVKPGDKADIAE